MGSQQRSLNFRMKSQRNRMRSVLRSQQKILSSLKKQRSLMRVNQRSQQKVLNRLAKSQRNWMRVKLESQQMFFYEAWFEGLGMTSVQDNQCVQKRSDRK